MAKKKTPVKKINLALQGGGAHGAYTWGVLDAFLEDGRLGFDGVCATSAGALNGAALAHGLSMGDNQTARETLERVWWKVSELGSMLSPVKRMPWEWWQSVNYPYEEAFSFSLFETLTNAFSPYQLNPFNINPLQTVIADVLDIERIRACTKIKLFITATEVNTGRARVFGNNEISAKVILASACLPFLFQAVTIDGKAYWDGGYVGNPALWPLFYQTDTVDLCVIHVNPIERHKEPRTAYDINNRLNEITFNASLMAELRAIAFVKKLVDQKWLKDEYLNKMKSIRLHAIRADHELKDLSVASKFQTDWLFLTSLRDKGRAAAQNWLKKNIDAVGVHETIDIHDAFLDYDGNPTA